MSLTAIFIFLAITLPTLGFLSWLLLPNARARIDARNLGLVVVRGRPTDRVLSPGAHFVSPFGRVIEQYPAHEIAYIAGHGDLVSQPAPTDPDYINSPLPVVAGDRTAATVSYTLRFRILPSALRTIHERFGPGGIKGIVRDESRLVIITTLAQEQHGLADFFGPARTALEAMLAERLRSRLPRTVLS